MSNESNLPAKYEEWQVAITANELEKQSVHTGEFASASKMNFEQFLLLRVLWVSYPSKGAVDRLPEKIRLQIPVAKQRLNDLPSWKIYLNNLFGKEISEGSFSMARYCQIQSEKNKESTRPGSLATPVSKRTRSHDNPGRSGSKAFQNALLETPSRKPKRVFQTPVIESALDNALMPESTPPSPQSERITPAREVDEELQQSMFAPTKDEQIVKTALLVFLNALSIHFLMPSGCNWTMHQKAFVAQFEEANFEGRVDGYLDDGEECPYALVETKPMARLKKNRAIQIQESAEMVSWIINDQPANLDKP